MTYNSIDYSLLAQKQSKTYKLSEVKDRLIKIAFDVVRFKDSPVDELWQVMQADDGEYLVARYNEEEETTKTASLKSSFSATASNEEVQIFYKGTPLSKFAHQDAETISHFMPNKLHTDLEFRKLYFNSLPKDRQIALSKLFPEAF